MKKLLLLAVAAMAVLSSCTEENEFGGKNSTGSDLTFTAIIEQSNATRTALTSEDNVVWTADDRISINGAKYFATPDNSDATQALFSKVSEAAVAAGTSPYYQAFYPADIYNNGTPTLPDVQYFQDGTISNLPMYAKSDDNTLCFKNICGVLAIKVTSADIQNVSAIGVMSSNKDTRGAFHVDADGNAVLDSSNDGTNSVILVCMTGDGGVTLDENGTVFYIAIPPQTYKNLIIYVTDGTTLSSMTTSPRLVDGITIERNTIYDIDFQSNAIQLNYNSIVLDHNGTLQLQTVTGIGDVTWTCDNESVATVDANGLVTAVGAGTTSIGATDEAGQTTYCSVQVYGITGTDKRTGNADVDYVRLWEGGPCFATFNVGATATSYTTATGSGTEWEGTDSPYTLANCGGHYQWGQSIDLYTDNSSSPYLESGDLTGDHDAATKLWGNDWRMPTASEWADLIDGLDQPGTSQTKGLVWTWCDGSTTQYVTGCTLAGYKVSGREGSVYQNNAIFLPGAGWAHRDGPSNPYYISDLSSGFYRGASYNDGGYFMQSLAMSSTPSGIRTGYTTENRYDGNSVRAVYQSEFDVTVSVEHGTVAVDKSRAFKGETVNVYATPATGYLFTSISVTDSNNQAVALTGGEGSVTSFTMPSSAVTVSATFTLGAALIGTTTYPTLSGAFAAASQTGEAVEIDVLQDIASVGDLTFSTNTAGVTFDCNGHQLSDFALTVSSGKLIFHDSNATPGTIYSKQDKKGLLQEGGEVTIDNGNIIKSGSNKEIFLIHINGESNSTTINGGLFDGGASSALWLSSGQVTINGGEFLANGDTGYAPIYLWGGYLTIYGGYFYSGDSSTYSYYPPSYPNLTIYGGWYNKWTYQKSALAENYIATGINDAEKVYNGRTYYHKVYDIAGTIDGHDWVRLWQDGPKWATTNVSATSPEVSGAPFQWGRNYNNVIGGLFNGQVQHTVFDAATATWGDHWMMPTEEDFFHMIQYCHSEYTTVNNVPGIRFHGYTGTGSTSDYQNNSIFLPAAGYFVPGTPPSSAGTGQGWYLAADVVWSHDRYIPRLLYFYENDPGSDKSTKSGEYDNYYFVRAIVAE